MATARSLSMIFVVAVLVASTCFAHVAFGSIPGKVRVQTALRAGPNTKSFILAPLTPGTVVVVSCRFQSEPAFGDPWWLKVTVAGIQGWVADHYVQCQSTVGNVCNISLC